MGKEKIKEYIEAVRKKAHQTEPNGNIATLDIVPGYDGKYITFTVYKIGTTAEKPPVANAQKILEEIHQDQDIIKLRQEAHRALDDLVFPDNEQTVMDRHTNAYNLDRVAYAKETKTEPLLEEETPIEEPAPAGALFQFNESTPVKDSAAFNFDKGPYDLNDFIPQTRRLVPPFKTVTSSRMREVNDIMMSRGMPNIKMATPQAKISDRAMLGNNNPTQVYGPCYKRAIDKLTKDRPKGLTEEQINDAITMLMNPDDEVISKKWGLEKSYNNSLLYKNLSKINKELPDYIGGIINEQYGRGHINPFAVSSAVNDEKDWARTIDFWGMIGKGDSYLRGEMVAALQYIKDYDGLEYKENPEKPEQFTMYYTRPNTSEKVALFSANTTVENIKKFKEGEEKSTEEIQQNQKFTTTFTINHDLPPDLYAKAVKQLLTYNVQYSQFTRNNNFPITQLSNDPVKNILLIMTAVGEYHLNVEITPAMKAQMENAIANYDYPDSEKVKQMQQLWQWVQDRSQVVAGFDTYGHKFINGGVINKLMETDQTAAEELSSLDHVAKVFRDKMQENAAILNLKSAESELEAGPGVAARLKPT